MKIKFCIFDLIAQSYPQRFNGNHETDNNESGVNWWKECTLDIGHLGIVYKSLSGVLVDLHEEHVADEDLRYGYF